MLLSRYVIQCLKTIRIKRNRPTKLSLKKIDLMEKAATFPLLPSRFAFVFCAFFMFKCLKGAYRSGLASNVMKFKLNNFRGFQALKVAVVFTESKIKAWRAYDVVASCPKSAPKVRFKKSLPLMSSTKTKERNKIR
jgi:hypothetical protein